MHICDSKLDEVAEKWIINVVIPANAAPIRCWIFLLILSMAGGAEEEDEPMLEHDEVQVRNINK